MDPTNREPEQHDPDAPGNREAYEDVFDRHDQATSGARGQQRPEPVDGAPTTNRFLPAVRGDRSPVPVAGRAAPPRPRPPRDPLTPDLGGAHPARRPARLVAGDLSLLVNPVDGSEIATCPPGERPGPPERHTAEAREEVRRAATPPVPAGPALARPPLLERQEEREHLVQLIARGRSVRLTGATGSGRTALLDAVAEQCADLAPDGVIRLTGFRRTVTDLFHDLYGAVFDSAGHRPDRATLVERVREIGAVVIVDDLSFGGTPLDELLDATPECAFLLAVDPDTPAPTADAPVEDVTLDGLSRAASTELLERATGRVLTEEESNWAGDLWFESEGLPLRFVQAGALLRQRDARRLRLTADDPTATGTGTGTGTEDGQPDSVRDLPLPSPAEAAAPAALLAADLSESARAALRFAVALDGEVPHQAHLPALVGDTHADAALAELAAAALVTPVGARHRLAAGVRTQLLAAGYPDDPDLADTAEGPGTTTGDPHALIAARHYAWWTGHPSVTPRRVAAEADAVLTALTAVASTATANAPLDPADEEGGPSAPVGLARAAAPVLAAGGDWNAWEAVLRLGVEAARHTGEVADEAYFHHELGVLALCAGQLGRARAELEASVALRGAVADRRGAVAGRRALALVTDRSGQTPAADWGGALGAKAAGARYEQPAVPPAAATRVIPLPPAATAVTAVPPVMGAADGSTTLVSSVRPPVAGFSARVRRARRVVLHGTRRNLAAAGAGALLAAVLGTVVTLGMISEDAPVPADRVRTNPSASQGVDDGRGSDDDGKETADATTSGDAGDTQNVADETDQRTGSTSRPVVPGATSATPSAPSASQSPGPGSSGRPTSSAPGGGPTEPSSPTTSTGTGPSPSGEPTPPASTGPPSPSAPPTTPTGQPPTTAPPTTGRPSTPPSPPAASSTTDRSAGPSGPVRVSPPAETADGADGPGSPDPVQ
ncbi:ATP-binding protein [Streptomyces sp. NPDC059816]|uniref:ATP-binding protein n=1 Tax=Streptomyces sp. NPDC059816 TaxID=3346960 RepID=UPI003649CCDA